MKLVVVPLDLGGHPQVPEISGHLIAILATESDDGSVDADALTGWPPCSPEVAPVRRLLADGATRRRFSLQSFRGFGSYRVTVRTDVRKSAIVAARRAVDLPSTESHPSYSTASRRQTSSDDRAEKISESATAFGAALERSLQADGTIVTTMSIGEWNSADRPPDTPIGDATWPLELTELQGLTWSYNGIRLPTETKDRSSLPIRFGTSNFHVGAAIYGNIVVRDRLRPNLTIARDRVQSVPVEILSAFHLAMHRAVRQLPRDRWADAINKLDAVRLDGAAPGAPVSLQRMNEDPLLARGGWNSAEVIRTDAGPASIDDIRRRAAEGVVILSDLEARWWWLSVVGLFDFMTLVRLALVQRELDVRWAPDPETGSGVLQVVSADRPNLDPGAAMYKPLYAVKYAAPAEVLFWGSRPDHQDFGIPRSFFLNVDHPLTRWLFAHATTLATDFAALFQRVFFAGPRSWQTPDTVNDALAAIARISPAIAPPSEAYLIVLEDGRWVSR